MKIWTIANQKGGVGKTTTTVSLGGLLSAAGRSVLLVDLDPHGSMTTWFGSDPDATEYSAYDLFARGAGAGHVPLAATLQRTRFPNLYLLPASTGLATLDRQLGANPGMGLVMARALAQCGSRFDHVLIDCPPMVGILLINALAACEQLVIPVQTEFLALKGLERMLRTLDMVNHSRRAPLTVRIVPTLYDRRTRAARAALGQLMNDWPADVLTPVVPIDTRFREASQAGVPLPLMAPGARGALAYRTVLAELDGQALPLADAGAVG